MKTKPLHKYLFYLSKPYMLQCCSVAGTHNNDEPKPQKEKDRRMGVKDYMINLLSEIEVRKLHKKIDLLMTEQMKSLFDIQKVQMNLMEEINSSFKK